MGRPGWWLYSRLPAAPQLRRAPDRRNPHGRGSGRRTCGHDGRRRSHRQPCPETAHASGFGSAEAYQFSPLNQSKPHSITEHTGVRDERQIAQLWRSTSGLINMGKENGNRLEDGCRFIWSGVRKPRDWMSKSRNFWEVLIEVNE